MAHKRIKVQPSKAQSKVGFIVGILFVVIGLVVAVPNFGLFGVIWTAVAALIAFVHFKNGFTSNSVSTHEIVVEEDSRVNQKPDGEEDIEEKLIKLNSLYEQHLITKEEYDKKRGEILDEF